MNRTIPHYGWHPDLPDARDHIYSVPASVITTLPPAVDLRLSCPPILDQGALGSCTANAIANAHLFDQQKQQAAHPVLSSRLFIYYNERRMEGTITSDAGAMIRDGMRSLAKQGACPESMWPYDIAQFARQPSSACYAAALQHQGVSYQRLSPRLGQLQGCLAAGYPFVFGFTVYESFESPHVATTGIMDLPTAGETVLGGHAVLAVGYDNATQRFLVMNSWGPSWGQQGFFTMPYAYLLGSRLAADFWTLRLVEIT